MNQEQIFEWIKEQKLQIEISEEQGYELVYLLDLPKLLENYHQMRMKQNTSGYSPLKFSQPNKFLKIKIIDSDYVEIKFERTIQEYAGARYEKEEISIELNKEEFFHLYNNVVAIFQS